MGLWCWGSHGLDWIGLISSSGLLLLLGFVIIRRERASERASHSFCKDIGLRLGCASMCLFFSFRFTRLTSLGQMAAVKATLPVHFRHGMQWQNVS